VDHIDVLGQQFEEGIVIQAKDLDVTDRCDTR